jgi:hypothetical protein
VIEHRNQTTTAILQTNTYRGYPYGISTIWIDLPDATINILIKGNEDRAKWLWNLITDDLKKELKEAERGETKLRFTKKGHEVLKP